jgi:hypothetical protein
VDGVYDTINIDDRQTNPVGFEAIAEKVWCRRVIRIAADIWAVEQLLGAGPNKSLKKCTNVAGNLTKVYNYAIVDRCQPWLARLLDSSFRQRCHR